MEEVNTILDGCRLVAEFIAALVGGLYFFKLKHSYWKWFSVYLFFIFMQEIVWYNRDIVLGIADRDYYVYIGIPVQYVFLYWLFALKSLKKPLLFIVCSIVYLLTLPLNLYFEKTDRFYSLNINLGTLILIVLIVLEFIKQIKNDNILEFRKNKMFYVNTGAILFYAGSYPFHIFSSLLYQQYRTIWDGYYTYFLIAMCLMYLLFAASFIWGKEN